MGVYFWMKNSLQQCMENLEKEVHLEYARTMNRMTFDKLVQANPKEFSYITLPEKEPERVPKGLCVCVCICIWTLGHVSITPTTRSCTGSVSVPDYPFEKNRAKFTFLYLLTKPEVISALSNVRAECNRVAAMSLFHVAFSKPLRREEFELAQSQVHTQVTLHLYEHTVYSL